MLDMSKAAIAPRQPILSAKERTHPLASEFEAYVRGMSRLGVQADPFSSWLASRDREAVAKSAEQHPRFPEFKTWMQANRGGESGRNPAPFPHNFNLWLLGHRW